MRGRDGRFLATQTAANPVLASLTHTELSCDSPAKRLGPRCVKLLSSKDLEGRVRAQGRSHVRVTRQAVPVTIVDEGRGRRGKPGAQAQHAQRSRGSVSHSARVHGDSHGLQLRQAAKGACVDPRECIFIQLPDGRCCRVCA